MTDQEFSTWTRQHAENLISQRDDVLARIGATATLESQVAALTTQLREANDKIAAMATHPDVVAADREKAISKAEDARLAAIAAEEAAIAAKEKAEKDLEDLGVVRDANGDARTL